jgi:hypothetical protein
LSEHAELGAGDRHRCRTDEAAAVEIERLVNFSHGRKD